MTLFGIVKYRASLSELCLPALSFRTKFAYGVGELGTAIPIGLAIFYLLFFLTEVVGLSPYPGRDSVAHWAGMGCR